MKTISLLVISIAFAIAGNAAAQNSVPSKELTYEEAKKLLPLPYPKASNGLRIQVWNEEADTGAVANLKAFFGQNQGRYIDLRTYNISETEKLSLYYQFALTLYVRNGTYRLPNGNLLYWGTQPKEWHNNGFVVTLGNSTQILATALLHKNCGKNNDLKPKEQIRLPECDEQPTLTIFYSSKFGPSTEINEEITHMAQRYIEINNRASPKYRDPIADLKIEVRILNK